MSSPPSKRSWALPFAVLIVAGIIFAIAYRPGTRSEYPEFMSELYAVQHRITPLSGRVLETSAPLLENGSIRATWEAESGKSLSEYRAWLTADLLTAGWQAGKRGPERADLVHQACRRRNLLARRGTRA